MLFQPMRLLRIPEPFDDPEFVFELKYDGFRALAHIADGRCTLVSRNGHTFRGWLPLREEIPRDLLCQSAILDGEIVCLDTDGRPDFNKLLFRRELPYFYAFDVLEIDGSDMRDLPLLDRKRRLKAILPRRDSRLRHVAHIRGRGRALHSLACQQDVEGVVAKWRHGRYQSGSTTSWLKIKNPAYSQLQDRHELFTGPIGRAPNRPFQRPTLLLA